MRVLHVIPSVSLVHGGPSRAVVAMEKGLGSAGADITTATSDDDGPGRRLLVSARPAQANGARRVYFSKWTEFYKVAPAFMPWLWRNIRSFDVVHIHALFSFMSIVAAAIAAAQRVPYVVRPLGTLAAYGVTQRRPLLKRLSLRFVEGPILRRAAFVQCTSDAELEEARALGLAFRGGVLALGVEPPAAFARRGRSGGRAATALFLSRLDPKKNVEGLLDAFAIVLGNRRDVRLIIAGDGPIEYVAALKQRAESLSIASSVDWVGHIEGETKAAAFADADIFVLPSHSENFGIAVVEAMLMGLPCILGHGVGIAGAVEAAGAGWCVATDPESIAAAIVNALSDEKRLALIGDRARRFAEREYSTQAMCARLMELYSSLIGPQMKAFQ